MKKCNAGSLTVGSSLGLGPGLGEAVDQIRNALVKGQGIAIRGFLMLRDSLQVAFFSFFISLDFLFASCKMIVL